jgi:hypothetical protein
VLLDKTAARRQKAAMAEMVWLQQLQAHQSHAVVVVQVELSKATQVELVAQAAAVMVVLKAE